MCAVGTGVQTCALPIWNDSTLIAPENIIGTLIRFGGAAMSPMFRYFLGFQLAADRAGWLARPLPPVSGDLFAGLKPQNSHLTLCTIDEPVVRSEERRVRKEGASRCNSRGSPYQ